MTDILQRLVGALPQVESWIDRTLEAYEAVARPVDTTRFAKLSAYLAPGILAAARVVTVAKTPFPPVSAYGLPEFVDMEQMDTAGITFRHVYFVSAAHAFDEAMHFHELVHTIQWRVLGVHDFLLSYGVGIAQFGYEASPLEAIAYELHGAFERNEKIAGLEERVGTHARSVRDATKHVFLSNGVRWDA